MLEQEEIYISPMPKTWILDLDGTIYGNLKRERYTQ